MQNSWSIRCRYATKIGAWPIVAALSAVAILLGISSAVQARSKAVSAPYAPAEGQHSPRIQNSIGIPFPSPRPPEATPRPEEIGKLRPGNERAIGQDTAVRAPSACQMRLTPDIAVVQAVHPISSGECAAEDVLRLDAVIARDGRRIAISPPATLRCPMAEALSWWVREELTSIAAEFGAPLKSLMLDTSYECRSRNRVAGAKLSEHGRANAVDLRGFTLANGKAVELTDPAANKDAREQIRETACARFTTVLGPGSDAYHNNHVHLDLIERRSGYRICQWDLRAPEMVGAVPLPPQRPASAGD